jgi:hypothetical protein
MLELFGGVLGFVHAPQRHGDPGDECRQRVDDDGMRHAPGALQRPLHAFAESLQDFFLVPDDEGWQPAGSEQVCVVILGRSHAPSKTQIPVARHRPASPVQAPAGAQQAAA